MKVSFRKMQNILIIVLFFSSFLGLISLGNVGSLSLTIPFIIMAILVCISIIGVITGYIDISKKRFLLFSILTIYAILSTLLSKYGSNFKSCMLYIFFFSSYVLIDKKQRIENIERYLSIFILISSVLSLYGVYQFVSYNFVPALPFKEIIPEAFWVSSMNTIAQTHTGTFSFGNMIRAHSVYYEPSIFSQFCAIAILFSLAMPNLGLKNQIISIIINSIGIVVSLSGTGLFVLIVGFLCFFIYAKGKTQRTYFGVIALLIIVCLFASDTDILRYFTFRANELFNFDSYSSGNYRFVLPFQIGVTHPLGYGIGNDDVAMKLAGALESSITNGFGKIFVELGYIGLVIIVSFFYTLYPRNNSCFIVHLVFFIVISLNVVGTFMLPLFWSFSLLLCCSINTSNDLLRGTKNECYCDSEL